MARINIEDDIESRDEFWRLLEILKNRDLCLGHLVRLFRLGQKRYGRDVPISQDDLNSSGLEIMKEAGWIIAIPGGFQVIGYEKQFAWYKQKIENGKHGSMGGRPKNSSKREPNKINDVNNPSGLRNNPSVTPLTLTPALTLANNTNTKKAKNTPSAVEPFQANPVAIWIDAYKKKYGVRYALQKKDFGFLKNAGQVHGCDALAVLFACYLAIDEKLYSEAKHPLSLFFRDLQKISHAAQSGVDPSKAKTDWNKIFGDENG